MTLQEQRPQLSAWLLVCLAFLALAIAFSARAALGLVMPLWDSELGWSRSFISSVAAAALIVAACVAPFTGRLVDRSGPRLALTLGLAVLSAGSFLVAVSGSRIVFLVAFGFVSALGFGIVATHVVSTAVAQTFRHNQA
jgi:MFS family permease